MRFAKIRQSERAGAPSPPHLFIDSTLPSFTAKEVTDAGKTERLQSEMARMIRTPSTPFSMLQSPNLPVKPTVDPKTYADIKWMYQAATRNVDSQATEMRNAALDNADTSSKGPRRKQLEDSLVVRTATTKVLQQHKMSTPYPIRPRSISLDRPAPRNQPSRFDFSLFQAALNDIRKSSATSTLASNELSNKSNSSRAIMGLTEENCNVVDVDCGFPPILENVSSPLANPRDHWTDIPMWTKGGLDDVTMTSVDGVSPDVLSACSPTTGLPTPRIDTTSEVRNPFASIESLPTALPTLDTTAAGPAAAVRAASQQTLIDEFARVLSWTSANKATHASSNMVLPETVALPTTASSSFSATGGAFRPVYPEISVFGTASTFGVASFSYGSIAPLVKPGIAEQKRNHAKRVRQKKIPSTQVRAPPPPTSTGISAPSLPSHKNPSRSTEFHAEGIAKKTKRGCRGGARVKKAREARRAALDNAESETMDDGET